MKEEAMRRLGVETRLLSVDAGQVVRHWSAVPRFDRVEKVEWSGGNARRSPTQGAMVPPS
jgi:hypothetical protein